MTCLSTSFSCRSCGTFAAGRVHERRGHRWTGMRAWCQLSHICYPANAKQLAAAAVCDSYAADSDESSGGELMLQTHRFTLETTLETVWWYSVQLINIDQETLALVPVIKA
jgi:hypothetical protein